MDIRCYFLARHGSTEPHWRLASVNANVEIFARGNAARSFIGGAASRTRILNFFRFGCEGDQVKAEQLFESILELVDLDVEFKEQRCFGTCIKTAGSHTRAELND